MDELVGLIFEHREFGLCKAISNDKVRIELQFLATERESLYSLHEVVNGKDFKHRSLPIGQKCKVNDRGVCSIVQSSFGPDPDTGIHRYLVSFEGAEGLTEKIWETELWPIPNSVEESALTKIIGLQPGPIKDFQSRELFLQSLRNLDKDTDGLIALTGSRIELLPHQVYVARLVTEDPQCRFILADEVGLGKTIEAGIILHQLLAEKPDARVLVLTPGSLARQWLCEMRVSFAGRAFRLLDLYTPIDAKLDEWPLVISSIKVALKSHAQDLLSTPWDLIIVDEAHQLLWSNLQYDFIQHLSALSPGLLLLSAIPARERSTELLRLLRLIDPHLYREGSDVSKNFEELYRNQPQIGRRWRILNRSLSNENDFDLNQVIEDADRLISTPMLCDDSELLNVVKRAKAHDGSGDEIRMMCEELASQVISKYRLSRRIIKNRRTQLIQKEFFHEVKRQVQFVRYELSDLSVEIEQIFALFLRSLWVIEEDKTAIKALLRKVLQSFCDSVNLYEIVVALRYSELSNGDVMTDLSGLSCYDYDDHDELLNTLGSYFLNRGDQEILSRLETLLKVEQSKNESLRVRKLKGLISELTSRGYTKILVFAGAPGCAQTLNEFLSKEYSSDRVASFCYDLLDDDKEMEVSRFRNDDHCFLLICDESGGEGRNFQFCDCIVHYDLPLSVAAVEQRIGRLDRVGREKIVESIVLTSDGVLERLWAECLDDGFDVFRKSISGLEFALRENEESFLEMVMTREEINSDEFNATINKRCEEERDIDDAEALTGAGSFYSRSLNVRLLREGLDRSLEFTMPNYFCAMSRPEVAKQIVDSKDSNLKIWRFQPELVTAQKLPGLDSSTENALRPRYGTFLRSVARSRIDLDFFTIGHPIVDALAAGLKTWVTGKPFFVKTSIQELNNSILLISTWSIERNASLTSASNKIQRLLGFRSVAVIYDLKEKAFISSVDASAVLKHLRVGGKTSQDLSQEEVRTLLDHPEPDEWKEFIEKNIELHTGEAKVTYKKRYQDQDEALVRQFDSLLEQLKLNRPDEDRSVIEQFLKNRSSLLEASLELDAIGLVQLT